MRTNTDKKQLRSFGLIVGGIFAGIGFWPLVIHGAVLRWWAVVIAALLICPALVYPKILYWPNRGWMMLGHVLGWINTRIILGLIFYVVVTPIGIIRSWLGKDPMGRQVRRDLDTYRINRKPRPAEHLKRQY
jgi:hypothetical protein